MFEAKGRPQFNPLIAHVTGVEAALAIAALDDRARKLAEAFWPGPLTLVAPVIDTAAVCDLARAGLDTVAVRAPDHPVAQAVLAAQKGADGGVDVSAHGSISFRSPGFHRNERLSASD